MKTITDLIYEYEDTEFSWGILDCAGFAANVAFKFKDKTVPNIQEHHAYSTAKGALKWMKKLGVDSLDEIPEIYIGSKKKDISEVKHGDIVYYINEKGLGIFGICNGCRAYFLQYGGGLTARSIEDCIYCWSVN